jgi:hypothetical protein
MNALLGLPDHDLKDGTITTSIEQREEAIEKVISLQTEWLRDDLLVGFLAEETDPKLFCTIFSHLSPAIRREVAQQISH